MSLNSTSIRLIFIVAISISPVVFLTFFGGLQRLGFLREDATFTDLYGIFALALSVLLGIGLAILGSEHLILKSLKALNDAMRAWHAGAAFRVRPNVSMPAEIAELSSSIHRATVVLDERERELQAAFAQQDLLMQEIHHRVKNNLQIIASLMNLQASRIKLPEARAEFQSARDRVRALATLHRHLYAHGELHSINMREFLTELCEQLFQAMGEKPGERIELEISAPELRMSSDQAVPLSLIVTEAVSNAIKYAFPRGRRGRVAVRLATDADDAELSITDDGIGVPAGRVETESGTRDGIGITLIRGFARQLGATLTVEENDGTRYVVRMKLHRDRIESPPLPSAA